MWLHLLNAKNGFVITWREHVNNMEKGRTQKFREEYKTNPYISESRKGVEFAYCKACRSDVKCNNILDTLKHWNVIKA